MLGICPWTDWPVNLTAWLWICDGNSIVSRARRFVFALILATSTPAASLPWIWCLSRFAMTSFTSVWSRHWQLRITHLQKLFVLSAEKAWKVNMNPASMSFFVPWVVSVLSIAKIWRTGSNTYFLYFAAKSAKHVIFLISGRKFWRDIYCTVFYHFSTRVWTCFWQSKLSSFNLSCNIRINDYPA